LNDNWHKVLLNALANILRPACFVELGLGSTPALHSVAEFCVATFGVDHSECKFEIPEGCTIFKMSTDEFFAEKAKTIPPPDLVFVDADHRSSQVLVDLQHLAEVCADNCIVVCHDTYPGGENYTQDGHCSDSFRVPDLVPWEHVTIPVHPGATIFRMKPVGRV
jgi:hypothetical protein